MFFLVSLFLRRLYSCWHLDQLAKILPLSRSNKHNNSNKKKRRKFNSIFSLIIILDMSHLLEFALY